MTQHTNRAPGTRRANQPSASVQLQVQMIEERIVPSIDCGDFKTFTQGGWGANPNGNNPVFICRIISILRLLPALQVGDLDSGAAFADNLAGDWAALFTSSNAIRIYLPDGSTGGALNTDLVDPTSTPAGVLAAQTLALTLNVEFDRYDPSFSAVRFIWLI